MLALLDDEDAFLSIKKFVNSNETVAKFEFELWRTIKWLYNGVRNKEEKLDSISADSNFSIYLSSHNSRSSHDNKIKGNCSRCYCYCRKQVTW